MPTETTVISKTNQKKLIFGGILEVIDEKCRRKLSVRISAEFRSHRIRMFLGLLDPSIKKQKMKKNLDMYRYCFVTVLWLPPSNVKETKSFKTIL